MASSLANADRQPAASSAPSGDVTLAQRFRGWRRPLTAFAFLTCAALYLAAINPRLYAWGDDGAYLAVARAIATGQGLRDIAQPGNPRFPYPVPLFPIMLAPFVYFFGYALVPIKIFVALTGVVAVYVAWRLFARLLDPVRAALLAALVAVSPQLVSFSHQEMAETPYVALSLGALLWAMRYGAELEWRTRAGVVTAILVAAALLTRTVGAALVLGVGLYMLIEGAGPTRRRVAKAALIGGTSAAAWLLANAAILTRLRYVSDYRHGTHAGRGLLGRLAANIANYREALPEMVFSEPWHWQHRLYGKGDLTPVALALLLIASAVLVAIIIGFFFSAIRRRSPLEYYAIFYGAALMVFDPSNGANLRRYVVPAIPLVLYYFVRGVEAIGIAVVRGARGWPAGERVWRVVTVTGLALLLLTNFSDTLLGSVLRVRPEQFDFYPGNDYAGYQRMGEWVRANTPPRSLVATQRDCRNFHVWAERQCVWLNVDSASPDSALAEALRRQRVSYIALGWSREAVDTLRRAIVARDTADFVRVYADGANLVYRVRAEGRGAAP